MNPIRLNISAQYSKELRKNKTVFLGVEQDKAATHYYLSTNAEGCIFDEEDIEPIYNFLNESKDNFKILVTLNSSFLRATNKEDKED